MIVLRRGIVVLAALALGVGGAIATAAAPVSAGHAGYAARAPAGQAARAPAGHVSLERTRARCRHAGYLRRHRAACRAARRRAPAGAPGAGTTTAVGAPGQQLVGGGSGTPAAPAPTPPVGATVPPASTTPTGSTTAPLPSRLAVDEYEYSVVAGHTVAAGGSIELNVSNIGQDDHDLTVSENGVRIAQTPLLHPGAPATTITVQLAPGTYKLYCSLYDHDQLGMHETLVVR